MARRVIRENCSSGEHKGVRNGPKFFAIKARRNYCELPFPIIIALHCFVFL